MQMSVVESLSKVEREKCTVSRQYQSLEIFIEFTFCFLIEIALAFALYLYSNILQKTESSCFSINLHFACQRKSILILAEKLIPF